MNNSTLEPNSPQLSTACDFNCDKRSGSATVAQVTRRQYRDSALTLPLLGFGMMRLPKISADNPAIDYAAVEQMFARALAAGVNYFDTAYFYHEGKSEVCAGEVLAQYPRDSYYLATKMPVRTLTSEADAERIFKEQLTRCKTGYFDFYLMHFLNRDTWQNATRFKLYDFLRRQQSEGRIGRIGFSFHD
ncbi:MAG: aldo/keto reductase, partial [Oligosphaeraceae bacterium]|nr:aldo/keto reductase [Oligosphaeraceae bacterium]